MMAGVHWPLGGQGQAGPSVGLEGRREELQRQQNRCREKPPTPGASPVRPGGPFVWSREWGRATAGQVQPIGDSLGVWSPQQPLLQYLPPKISSLHPACLCGHRTEDA